MNLKDKTLIQIEKFESKYGALPKEIRFQIEKLLVRYGHKNKASIALPPNAGNILAKEYKGKNYTVVVLDKGFLFDNKNYKSLSAIANEITGTHCNGKRFFGVRKPKCYANTAVLNSRSSVKLSDCDVGLQTQSAETHRSKVAR